MTTMGGMADRRFRFGIVAGLARSGPEWTGMASRAEELGYDTLLVPDTVHTISPFAALAAAAASTQRLRVGTYVLSAPNRQPGLVAWETASLDMLSGGRFELGLGAGRPNAAPDAAQLGTTFGTPAERLGQVADVIDAVESQTFGVKPVQQPRPPILIAAGKPQMMRLAAAHAQIVAFALPPDTPETRLAAVVTQLREIAGDRFDQLELHLNLAATAETPDAVPDWLARAGGGDPRAAAGGLGFLIGSRSEIVDTLRRRRDELGISYVAVNGAFMDAMAPIVDTLAGT
jgi:probable F420-dependent oxidoreductase